MDLTVIDEQFLLTEEQTKWVVKLMDYAATFPEVELAEDTEMSISFIGNDEIQEINKKYRGKDQPTDVISFAIEDEGEEDFSIDFEAFDIPRNIGDLFVSIDKVKEQALEYNHSFERELGFLVIHGFLHLNGYDHMNAADEKEMFDLQRKILDSYGLKR
ncbi:rRNA maturation RNase YbeY [Vagococcus sp.]|uniref:rRNA maturation RNase YbeY n=1 Tax=Vagococcus sp. TaxID=1933889 RepID=UPI003F998AB1